ncbi:hypothetical protein SAY86_008864 [Trapa natans]|uniref:Uncharacterized protein n=1 Tax=Trapa natans TaxID=22666 RepID=A0AAN7QBE6_TRANT|nr:hypothetical protein SAY86_008864 [Trapa natans]
MGCVMFCSYWFFFFFFSVVFRGSASIRLSPFLLSALLCPVLSSLNPLSQSNNISPIWVFSISLFCNSQPLLDLSSAVVFSSSFEACDVESGKGVSPTGSCSATKWVLSGAAGHNPAHGVELPLSHQRAATPSVLLAPLRHPHELHLWDAILLNFMGIPDPDNLLQITPSKSLGEFLPGVLERMGGMFISGKHALNEGAEKSTETWALYTDIQTHSNLQESVGRGSQGLMPRINKPPGVDLPLFLDKDGKSICHPQLT